MARRGMGKGKGKGWKNIMPDDSRRHSLARKGVKTAQKIRRMPLTYPYNILSRISQKEKKEILDELKKEGKMIEQYDIKKSLSPIKKNKEGEVILYQHYYKGRPSSLYYEVAYYDDGEVQILDES